MLQIAEGMSYLHSKNLAYCDLKPTRLMTCRRCHRPARAFDLALQKILVMSLFRDLHCIHLSNKIYVMVNFQKNLHIAEHLSRDPGLCTNRTRGHSLHLFALPSCKRHSKFLSLAGESEAWTPTRWVRRCICRHCAVFYRLFILKTAAIRVSTLTLKPKP
jgi:serine/threonine protein kinase